VTPSVSWAGSENLLLMMVKPAGYRATSRAEYVTFAAKQYLLPMHSCAMVSASIHDYHELGSKIKTAMKGAGT
jgi:hypothetical protein